MSACLGKNFCTSLHVLIRLPNSQGSWKNDLSGLWYVSDIALSWNGEFSSKSVLSSWFMSILPGIPGIGILTG